jgi:hypothetical protein
MSRKQITAESRIRQSEDIVARGIEDETVMMSLDKGRYYGLDPIGSLIWSLVEKPILVSDLVERLLADYVVDRETCTKDVLAFLSELYEDGALRVEE